jgi:hypothetical protein
LSDNIQMPMAYRLAVLCLLPLSLLAQEASITLAGTVVNAATGEPMSRVLVSLNGYGVRSPDSEAKPDQIFRSQGIHRSLLTDAGGGFRFLALPAANYRLTTQKPGFRENETADSSTGNGDLNSSQENLKLTLAPLGVITGKVISQYGDPMLGVMVDILQETLEDGLRHARRIMQATTDDRGIYRAANLRPGKYYAKILGQNGSIVLPAEGHAEIGDAIPSGYEGGRTVESATPIEIGAATEATSDFHVKPEPAWRIRGTLRGLVAGENLTWSLLYLGEEMSVSPDRFNPGTGAFELREIVNGSYLLRAQQGNRIGEAAITVKDGDAAPIEITLFPPVDVRVNVRSTNKPPVDESSQQLFRQQGMEPCQVSLAAEKLTGAVSQRDYGYFSDRPQAVAMGIYRVQFDCVNSWVQSALMGQQDLLSDPVVHIQGGESQPPIEILATWGGGTLHGHVEAAGSPEELHLLVVPRASHSTGPVDVPWSVDDDDKDFTFPNLAPGAYTLYAFRKDVEYRNPEFVQKLTGGQAIQIDGDKVQEVTVREVIQ